MREGDRTLKVSLPISVSLVIRFVLLHMHMFLTLCMFKVHWCL